MPKMNVKNQWPLVQFFTFGKVQEIKISFAIVMLKVTVIRFPKARFKFDFGLQIQEKQMLKMVGTQYLALWLKKFHQAMVNIWIIIG